MPEFFKQNMPIKKEFSELTEEFFTEAATEIEKAYTEQKEKPSIPRILFHNFMRKRGYDDVSFFAKGFKKILEIFQVKDDEELIKLLIKKRKENMPWAKNPTEEIIQKEETAKNKPADPDNTKPLLTKRSMRDAERHAYHQDKILGEDA